jgi:hypothetical protein
MAAQGLRARRAAAHPPRLSSLAHARVPLAAASTRQGSVPGDGSPLLTAAIGTAVPGPEGDHVPAAATDPTSTHTLSLPRMHTHTHRHRHTHRHPYKHRHTHKHAHTHTHSLTDSFADSLTHSVCLSVSLSLCLCTGFGLEGVDLSTPPYLAVTLGAACMLVWAIGTALLEALLGLGRLPALVAAAAAGVAALYAAGWYARSQRVRT